ncbi:hypothetical protein HYH02_005093 [Chlamydomonas schloesseri]|uniref:Protein DETOXIFICATION n=1 Tax=Chlamydomonas schloesseri TaxID=2026947 RepID=A0A835WLC1_9CHLO|nr:hypothetical protein HYH02_005093 [Chlamydomonas schloesseri]|eukprot:KAG2449560.1 hypothetical protein HYH02_005093 [Chlamydomonas schloesseri]
MGTGTRERSPSPLRSPLLGDSAFANAPALASAVEREGRGCVPVTARLAKDFVRQLALAGPLGVNLCAANAASIINLLFVARGGTVQLAAAAIGNNVAVMLGRLVLLGLCGALDTLAAQAWGAGKEGRLPLLLQRTVLFLWMHCAAISAAMLALPCGLAALGQDPVLSSMVRTYILALLPSVWLEAVTRPITRVLVARGIASPQMYIALVGLPLNIATNYALVIVAGWEYVGAAAATSASAGYDLLLLLAYVLSSGQWSGVVGTPTRRAFKGWRQLARLAYPAASMKCAESWAFTIMTLAASLLPSACTATAAVGVSYNVYGVLFIAFVACSTAACVTVGNRLGAGDAMGAKFAAVASLLIVPVAWGAAAVALLVPACQNFIINMFVAGESPDAGGGDVPVPDPGGLSPDGGEEALRLVLRHMFIIVAGLVLLDGVQTILSGVIQGCGRQRAGAVVNLVAFYVFAVPMALGMAFRVQLPGAEAAAAAWWGRLLPPGLRGAVVGLGLGPEGLYLGMAVGPVIQTICYTFILLRTNWQKASEQAMHAAMQQSTTSLAGLLASSMRRLDPGALAGPSLVRATSNGSTAMPGTMPWLLPVIEEHSAEGRDSSDGQLCSRHGAGPNGDRPGDSRADILAGFGLDAWSPVRTPPVGSAGQTLLGSSPPTFGPGALIAAGAGGLGAAAVFGASPPRPGPGGAAQVAQRITQARHIAASCGNAAIVTSWPSETPGPAVGDLSPYQAARSHALILDHGSPPPAMDQRLASTLDPSVGAMSTPSTRPSVAGTPAVLLLPLGSVQSRASGLASTTTSAGNTAHGGICFSALAPPASSANGKGPTAESDVEAGTPSGRQEPAPLGAAGASAAAAATASIQARTAAASSARSLLRALLSSTAGTLAVTGPLAVPEKVEAPALVSAAAGAGSRWFRFGWRRSGGTAAEPIKAASTIAVAVGGEELPLQLPGLVAGVTAACGSPAVADVIAAAAGGAGTVPGTARGDPSAKLHGSASKSAQATSGADQGPAGDSVSAPSSASSSASVLGAAADCGSDGDGAAAISMSATSAVARPAAAKLSSKGEVFRSCESLAAAEPGSMDVYAFSPSGTPAGGSWLDNTTPRCTMLATSAGPRPGGATGSAGSAGPARSGGGASLSNMLRVALFGSAAAAATPRAQAPPVAQVIAAISHANGQLGELGPAVEGGSRGRTAQQSAFALPAGGTAGDGSDSDYADARTHRSSSGSASGWATPAAAGSGVDELA